MKNYELLTTQFLTKQLPFDTFITDLYKSINLLSPGELYDFYNYIIDIRNYDNEDIFMLLNIAVWLFPNRLNSTYTYPDNMYTNFLKEIRNSYIDDFKQPLYLLSNNIMSLSLLQGNLYIFINQSETDVSITLPTEIQNSKHYCINCGDELEFKEKIELYPYGFYIIEK